MILEFAKQAIANIEKNNIKFDKLQGISVKDGWNFCSECGFLEPLTDKDIEFYRKEGYPEENLKRKEHKRFEGRTIPLKKAWAIHGFAYNWINTFEEQK